MTGVPNLHSCHQLLDHAHVDQEMSSQNEIGSHLVQLDASDEVQPTESQAKPLTDLSWNIELRSLGFNEF